MEWPTGPLTIALYIVTSIILLLLTRGLNETLKELEKERDLSAELFRELQHRTANNLQNVSALLRQNREAIRRDPGKAVDVVESAERRFEIMSRINRRLYNPEMQDVEATPLLEALCQDILASMGNNNVLVVVSPSSIRLRREKALLLSLIVAELMMNATKHAFDHGRPGSVVIRLEAKGSAYHLIFTDDGKGLPEGSSIATISGLGSGIVRSLVEQMAGTFAVKAAPPAPPSKSPLRPATEARRLQREVPMGRGPVGRWYSNSKTGLMRPAAKAVRARLSRKTSLDRATSQARQSLRRYRDSRSGS